MAGREVGSQSVAGLPSTAAKAGAPAWAELAVAAWQRSGLVVGARSGRWVSIVNGAPART